MKQILKKQIEDVKDPPNAIGGMTKSELDTELARGIASLKNYRSYSADEVDTELYLLFEIHSDEITK